MTSVTAVCSRTVYGSAGSVVTKTIKWQTNYKMYILVKIT